jgi:hypothetical protein
MERFVFSSISRELLGNSVVIDKVMTISNFRTCVCRVVLCNLWPLGSPQRNYGKSPIFLWHSYMMGNHILSFSFPPDVVYMLEWKSKLCMSPQFDGFAIAFRIRQAYGWIYALNCVCWTSIDFLLFVVIRGKTCIINNMTLESVRM